MADAIYQPIVFDEDTESETPSPTTELPIRSFKPRSEEGVDRSDLTTEEAASQRQRRPDPESPESAYERPLTVHKVKGDGPLTLNEAADDLAYIRGDADLLGPGCEVRCVQLIWTKSSATGSLCRNSAEGRTKVQMMKKAVAVSLAMIVMPTLSLAEWKIEGQGAKVMNLPNDRIGTIATLPAKAASYGVTAYLQIECFKSPTLTQKHFAVVVTKNIPPGLPYRVKFDDDTPVQRGPYTRAGDGTVHGLDDEAFERLPRARRLQLSLLQPQGPELTFDFDVTGAASAINAIPCER